MTRKSPFQNEKNAYTRRFTKKNIQITSQILHLLQLLKISQRDLAQRLGKTEAEVSRLLSGTHNFTLKSIAKVEEALGHDVITTPLVNTSKGEPPAENSLVDAAEGSLEHDISPDNRLRDGLSHWSSLTIDQQHSTRVESGANPAASSDARPVILQAS